MNLLRKGERGSSFTKILPTILLFCFLIVIITTFILILLSDKSPKEVTLDLKQIAESTVDVPEPPIIKTDLLLPENDPIYEEPPVAQFTVTSPVLVGEKVEYEDHSYSRVLGGSIVNWRWEGKRDYFVKPGSYTVSLKVQDDQGAWSETVSRVVHVVEKPEEKYVLPPIAMFKATNPVYVGETVVYEDVSYDPNGFNIVDRQWEGKQTHFNAPGKYRVSLMVKNSEGKWSDPVYQYIEVKERPVVEETRRPIAIFDVTSPVYVGQTVVYTNKSFSPDANAKIVKTEWSANKRSSYDKVGTYDITLRVQDNRGLWSESFTRTVHVIDRSNMPPVANFTTNSPVYVGQKVEWKNTSYDEDGVIAREQWGGDKRYMYTEAGEYQVTLTVWDDRGAKSSITKKIIVLNPNVKAPVAKFHTNSPVQEGERVYFWDDSYHEDGTIVKREWSGDKRDVYEEAGFYQVTLTVWDEHGAYSTHTETIEVRKKENVKPVAQISGPTEVYVYQNVIFIDESYDADGYIVSNSWGSNKLHKSWDKPGVYYVDLEVTDNRGAVGKTTIAVYVRDEGYPLGP